MAEITGSSKNIMHYAINGGKLIAKPLPGLVGNPYAAVTICSPNQLERKVTIGLHKVTGCGWAVLQGDQSNVTIVTTFTSLPVVVQLHKAVAYYNWAIANAILLTTGSIRQ